MSYQVLARKYRPANFAELVGQEHVLKALSSALDHQRMHHAYLFTGTRGVGKTTIARILARCLNCDEGVSSTPCGQCSACNEIDQGRFVDLIEVDAASRTKVEDTRELLENVQYSPSRGRYKVYLIDEVHMLSNHSFNALLKTLEEPPPHVVFLLATTDPQKLPPTVLSRCLQFNLKNMTAERIVGHLKTVLAAEEIPAEDTALWQLARAANGSMRDALSLTDQAIAFSDQNLTEAAVASMLGSMDQSQVHALFAAIAAGNASEAMAVIDRMDEQSPDYGRALSQLLSLLHQLALHKSLPDYQPALSEHELSGLAALADAVSAEEIQLYYQLGLKSQADLAFAPDPRSGFEMAVLRMIAFRPVSPDNLAASSDNIVKKKTKISSNSSSQSVPQSNSAQASQNSKTSSVSVEPLNTAKELTSQAEVVEMYSQKSEVENYSSSNQQPVKTTDLSGLNTADNKNTGKSSEARLYQHENAAATLIDEPSLNHQAGDADLTAFPEIPEAGVTNEHWLALYPHLQFTGLLANFANHCVLHKQEGTTWYFLLDKGHAAIQGSGLEKQLSDRLNETLARKINLEFSVAELSQDSPAKRQRLINEQQRLAALKQLKQQPTVQWLMESFSAEIDEQSVSFIQPNKIERSKS